MLVVGSRAYVLPGALLTLCKQLLTATRVCLLLSGYALPVPPPCCHPHKAPSTRATEIIIFTLVIKIFYTGRQQKENILPRGAKMRKTFNMEAS